jgi:hypothetical protein
MTPSSEIPAVFETDLIWLSIACELQGEDEGVDARIVGHRKDLNDERLMGGRVFFQHANPEFCQKVEKDGNAEIERIRLMYRERQAILKTRAR